MLKRKRILFAVLAILAFAAVYAWQRSRPNENAEIVVQVKKGDFEILVNTTGELEAKNSVSIQGPSGMRAAQIWQVKINRLVPEGSRVQKGDFVCELDKSPLVDKIKERQTQLTKVEAQFLQTKLDTALTLRKSRDNLIKLKFAIEEKKIALEQSAFEPPATIKQAKIELEKAEREYILSKENYKLEESQAMAKMQEVYATLESERRQLDFYNSLLQEFTITAPEPGMVVYARDWGGRKKREGSQIEAWMPTVATLPDLSTMISKTYINEVDIMKVKKGQQVRIGLDAFPEKKLTGEVVEVANMGEQKPNSDAKVFEVVIQVNEMDTTLRPAMTTGNLITTEVLTNVLSVPLESLHSQGDSLTYVFKKEGISWVRQQVKIGKTNDNEAVIEAGLTEQDRVLLSVPEKPEDMPLLTLPTETPIAQQP